MLRKKWVYFQTKAQKSAKVHFIWEIWWPVWESGRSVPYPKDSRTIRESWHNYALYENDCVKTGVTMYLWWTFYQWRAPKGNSAFKCTTGNASLELNVYNNNNLYIHVHVYLLLQLWQWDLASWPLGLVVIERVRFKVGFCFKSCCLKTKLCYKAVHTYTCTHSVD